MRKISFQYTIELDQPLELHKKVKGCFIISNEGYSNEEPLLFKLFLENKKKERVLLNKKRKKFKSPFKFKFKFSILSYPGFKIDDSTVLITEIYSNTQLIDSFITDSITYSLGKPSKFITFKKLNLYSKTAIPNCDFPIWIEFINTLPEEKKFTLHAKLSQLSDDFSHDFSLKPIFIGNKKSLSLPIRIPIPDFSTAEKNINIPVDIVDENNVSFYSKILKLNLEMNAKGIRYEHVGFKRDVKIGELAILLGHIDNKNDTKLKGKAEFSYYSFQTGEIPLFKRKYQIFPQNYEKISEDALLPLSLAGRNYWVICRTKIKGNFGKIPLEGVSSKSYCKIPKIKSFNVDFRALVMDDGVFFGDKIPLEINIRVDSRDFPKNLVCTVYQRIDFGEEKQLKSFKVKDRYYHTSFTWIVPKEYGNCNIFSRFSIAGNDIDQRNIEGQSLNYELIPKPKKEKAPKPKKEKAPKPKKEKAPKPKKEKESSEKNLE